MPAFTFEKISKSKRLPADAPTPVIERRSIVTSLLDRMTKARLKKAERNFVRFECSASSKDQA